MHLTTGSLVGSYRILAPLGAGGMGEVYRARDEKLNRDVALKILSADLASSAEHLRRFQQEAHAASALNHPNIITIYDIGQYEGVAYIAMEIVDGQDLRTLQVGSRLPMKSILRTAVKVADGLAAAHERGIVHRDLKPENVMISRDGFVKILDFGLAKLVKPITENQTTAPHTTPGAVFGTVAYMSPEQAAGRAVDFRSDQFSLGVIIYEMLTGRMAFSEASAAETLASIIRNHPAPASTINEEIPNDLDRVLARCLAKDPADRYASTRDLARDLREIRDRISNTSEPRYRSDRPKLPLETKRATWIVAAAAVFVIIAIAAVVKFRPSTPAQASTAHLASSDQQAYAQAVTLLQRAKDEKSVDDAISILEKLLQNARDSAPVNAQLARALLYKAQMSRRPGLIEQATVYAERAVELDGTQPEIHIRLGQLRSAAGRYAEAETEYKRALELRNDYPDAYLGLAETNEAMGRAADAEAMYAKAIALRPDHANTYNRYAVFLFNNGRHEEAAKNFRRFTELMPTSRGFSNLGASYQAMGNYEEARKAYERSLALEPTSNGYVNIGALYYYMGDYARACSTMERATALAPSSYLAWLGLGDAYRWSSDQRDKAKGTYETALKTSRDAISVNAKDAVAHAAAANALAKLGRSKEAAAEMSTALKLDPTNQSVLYTAALVAMLKGNRDVSVGWLQRAVNSGYPLADLQRDPEFQSIQSDPSFPKRATQHT